MFRSCGNLSIITGILAILLLDGGPTCPSGVSAQSPVQRASNDRESDLIGALSMAGRFDDAIALCEQTRRRHPEHSTTYALATTRLCVVMMRQQVALGNYDQDAVMLADGPLDRLLTDYPDHARRLFLEASKHFVSQIATEMAVAVAAIGLNDQQNVSRVAARLVRLSREVESLTQEVRRSINSRTYDAGRDAVDPLLRLENELSVAAVSMALLQTELFPPESADAISAATSAAQTAVAALEKMPAGSPAAREIRRMEIAALLRSGSTSQAAQRMENLVAESETNHSAAVLALQVEIQLQLGQTSAAASLLESGKRFALSSGALPLEIDLAKLRYLLHQGDDAAASRWIADLESRHGAYARRRGEAIAISMLDRKPSGRTGSSGTPSASSVSLIETRGRQSIRQGDFEAGGQLLTQALRASLSSDQAFPIALTAAAAFNKAGKLDAASAVLADVAIRFPDAPQSATLHLQAAVLLSEKSKQSDQSKLGNQEMAADVAALVTCLRAHLRHWPQSETSETAANWLMRIFDSRNKPSDAAKMTSEIVRARPTPRWIDAMRDRWAAAFLASESREQDLQLSLQATESITGGTNLDATDQREVIAAWRAIAATYFDPRSLDSIANRLPNEADWVEPVLRFRRGLATSDSLLDLTGVDQAVQRRLIRDGQHNPQVQTSVAKVLAGWKQGASGADTAGKKLRGIITELWLGNVDESIRQAKSWRSGRPSAEELISMATLFQNSSHREANVYAAELWDRLASGTQVGSQQWHKAKIGAIQSMHQSGQADQAAKRARYILLTNGDLSPRQRRRYQEFLR